MIFDILLITVGLSMDSLVVSIVGGATAQKCRLRDVLKIAVVMGIFQGGLTAAGYMCGVGFEQYIGAFDHWVAFGLLSYLGGKMIYEELFKRDDERTFDLLNMRTLIYMAFATSIDAIAVGISLAFLRSPIVWQSVIIGGGTFIASAFGVCFGRRFGRRTNLKLGIVGGIILIGIGIKILIEHIIAGA